MAGRTVWEDTIAPEDRRVLDPGVPADLDRTPDVLVVGGGIVGLACAAMCVRAGIGSVVLLERGRLAGGVSGSAAGGLSPDTHWADGAAFVELARRSLALHRELDAEWGYGLEPLDEIIVGEGFAGLAEASGAQPVTRDQLPEIVGPDVAEGLRFADQARVHPLEMAAAFARRAGQVVTGVEVTEVMESRVETSIGGFFPGAVALATGTVAQVSAAQSLVKGHLIATTPASFRLPVALASVDALVLQLPDGRLVAGGTLDDDTEDIVREDIVERVRRELLRIVPGASGLDVTHAWCCFRPATADLHPVIDRVSEAVWVTCGHFRTGLLMAPATGEAVASWIGSGECPPGVEGFDAERFAPPNLP